LLLLFGEYIRVRKENKALSLPFCGEYLQKIADVSRSPLAAGSENSLPSSAVSHTLLVNAFVTFCRVAHAVLAELIFPFSTAGN